MYPNAKLVCPSCTGTAKHPSHVANAAHLVRYLPEFTIPSGCQKGAPDDPEDGAQEQQHERHHDAEDLTLDGQRHTAPVFLRKTED